MDDKSLVVSSSASDRHFSARADPNISAYESACNDNRITFSVSLTAKTGVEIVKDALEFNPNYIFF